MLLKAVAICSFIYLAFWMYKDLKARQVSFLMSSIWIASLVLVPYICLPLYFITRAFSPKRSHTLKQKTLLCPKCGYENKPFTTQCKKCGNTLGI